MSFNSISTVLTGDDDILPAAIELARAWGAHLDVMCVAVDASVRSYSFDEISPVLIEGTLIRAQEAARDIAHAAQARLQRENLTRATVHPIVTQGGLLATTLRRHLRFSDLMVVPRPYGPEAGFDAPTVVEAALFDAAVPVLVLPGGHDSWTAPRRIGLAWNESDAALRAARAACPMLTAADTTYVAVIDPPQHGPDRSDPGGLIAEYLARKGARCEIDVLARTLPRISDHMVRMTKDRDIDLMVMGAYGRARWSEAMFGGATRDMLELCPVPLLLAH